MIKMRASTINIILLVISLLAVISSAIGNGEHHMKHFKPKKMKKHFYKGLELDFYRKTCPQLEKIVQDITWSKVEANPAMAAKLLRLHYHDCFVRGCDASILIDPVKGDNSTEKNAPPNRSIQGYEVIDEIKAKIEEVCPQTVSCADITALAARDAVSFQKEPLWRVYTGRRDGRVSLASEASRDLPSGGSNFTTLRDLFARFDLNEFDLVTLSGAHTIGVTRCALVSRRLFNFTGKGDTDPSLDPKYAAELKAKCANPPNPTSTTLELDRGSSLTFDSHYFKGLNQNQGLLVSDAALLTNRNARNLAKIFEDFRLFRSSFAHSMVKMGSIEVLTGDEGEIRKNCRVIN